MIYYLPLEHIDARYTTALDRDIVNYFKETNTEYVRIYPDVESLPLPPGMFLNAAFTTKFKSLQLAELASYYESNLIQNGDIIFCSDLWFPGIESVAYMNYFCKKKVKLRGFIHAGSFTDTDFVRDMERWAKNFEDVLFDISDKVYVASEFIKNDIIKKRFIQTDKLEVSRLPLDYAGLNKYRNSNLKENLVVFNGRNCDEKQPWLFDELARSFDSNFIKPKFVNTQELNLSKDEYYKLLSKAKVVVSFALQENFGFGINEAVYLGCTPVLPNRLVYPEFYSSDYLYNNFEECKNKVWSALTGNIKSPSNLYIGAKSNTDIFNQWFN